ncbi:hypothetical protein RUM44_008539 [Polyplax serrata]|uniref:Uncharacterized protein n=1 Tax=Polyplax serrata TaxID=468196 RepID=A0ABR1BCM2_POLSC
MRNKLKRKETWSMVKRTGDEKFPAGGPTSDKTWRIVYEDHEQVVQEACERKAEAEEEEEEAEGEESSERIPPMRIFRWGAQAAPIENDLSDGTGGHAHDARVSYLGGTRKKVADALLYPPTEGFAPETFRINHEQEVDNTRQTIGKETGATSS